MIVSSVCSRRRTRSKMKIKKMIKRRSKIKGRKESD
jgi:hypothetical protein